MLTGGFFINLFFSLWLIRLYSSLANYVYETSVLQKNLMYNYDLLFLNYQKFIAGKRGSVTFEHGISFLTENVKPLKNWVFDYRDFMNKNNTDSIHIADWYKRLDVALGDTMHADTYNYVSFKLYCLYDLIAEFFLYFFNIELNPDEAVWLLLIFISALVIAAYFVDPLSRRFDVIERRLYLHERYLEEKFNKGAPIDMKDSWIMKGEAFYENKDMWRTRAYYNIHQNPRTDDFREPPFGQS